MRKLCTLLIEILCIYSLILSGCTNGNDTVAEITTDNSQTQNDSSVTDVKPGSEVVVLTDDLSAVEYSGNDYFEDFILSGGAPSDSDVMSFLTSRMASAAGASFGGNPFGCSTLSVQSENGDWLFGRNFDWNNCNALIVKNTPETGYSSICTANTDFIQGISLDSLPDEAQALIGIYAPLDGMNEKGLCVSVNMISDSETIEQNTDKTDITTTTAIRLILNKAATTEEAIELLGQYDFHASFGYMVHFAVADASGNSVAIEYINNEMVVTDTPVLTNFYVTQGEKYGIGTSQSHTRFEILEERLAKGAMSENDVRDALSSVSKQNFGGYESTEWSVVFNQTTGEVQYYYRENYDTAYSFSLS